MYYKEKIDWPYEETIGVGANSKTITCNTVEEYQKFLCREDAHFVYSNSQEIIAIANIYIITIKVFSFGVSGEPTRCEWYKFSPDPEMSSSAVFPKGLYPGMYLYNSDQNHFDLLVPRNHPLVSVGLKKDRKHLVSDVDKNVCSAGNNDKAFENEKLLIDEADVDYDKIDLEELFFLTETISKAYI